MKPSLRAKLPLSLIRSVCNNENGAVLIVGLVFMVLLAMLGITAVVMTTTDMKIGGNYKTVTQAFNVAEAGTAEARARLSISKTADDYAGDPAGSPDEWWSAYILTDTSFVPSNEDSNYTNYIPTAAAHTNTTHTVNSLQTEISYAVKIRHKREFDAEEAGHTVGAPHYYDNDLDTNTNDATDPGNIIYYGYGDPTDNTKICEFTIGAGTGLGNPVEIITGHGKAGGSFKTIQTEVTKALPPPILATLYGKDTTTINGSSGSFSGIDECGVAAPIDPVYVYNADTPTDPGPPPIYTPSNIVETSPPTYAGAGSPPAAQEGGIDIDITGYVDSMKDSATEIITSDQNSGGYGGVDDYVTCYCNSTLFHPAGLDMRNLTGYGMLLVEGDLTLSGGFNWYGLVIVTGTLTLNGGGAGINIRGAAMGNQTVDINGGLDLRYDSCEITNAMLGQGLKIITWADILN
jgi:Tfp pilus assembly protein PilX